MLEKENKKPELYRIVIIFSIFILLCVEIYTFLLGLHTVTVSSFDVEIAANIIKIDESKKTFSINNQNGYFIKTSKEYKEVLASSWNKVALIDIDNQLKILDSNETVLAVFENFSLDTNYITSTRLFEEQDIIKINFIGSKNEKEFNIDYCYNKNTEETYVIEN